MNGQVLYLILSWLMCISAKSNPITGQLKGEMNV